MIGKKMKAGIRVPATQGPMYDDGEIGWVSSCSVPIPSYDFVETGLLSPDGHPIYVPTRLPVGLLWHDDSGALTPPPPQEPES